MWFALVLTAGLLTSAGSVKFFEGSWEDALKESIKTKKLVYVDFYTDT